MVVCGKVTMHTLHSYFKPGVGASKRQDKPLPDPNGLLSSTIPAAAIRDANDAHTRSSQLSNHEANGNKASASTLM